MSLGTDFSRGLKLDPQTSVALGTFAHRRRLLLLLRGIAAGLVFLVLAMLTVAACDYLLLITDGIRWTLSLIGYGIALGAAWWLGIRPLGNRDPRILARQLESADPLLREDLLSAVELADPNEANGSASFRSQLQRQVGSQSAALDFGKLLPVSLVKRWLFASVLVAVACVTLLMIPQLQFARRIARAMLPLVAIERASSTEIDILKPSPPTGFVAEGDAVGVTVLIGGKAVDEVWMQWMTADGIKGESIMTPRVKSPTPTQTGTLDHQNTYAANLSVGTAPVRYRIVAGDAITLWHQLNPLPRPKVESFEKRYQFPTYAKLPDRVEVAEHGDLKALSGSRVALTLRFDEPVEDAKMSFGNRGVSFSLTPVEGSDREFVTSIPISTPANYQVDATSRRSGLNHPFSPQYSVSPVLDVPPSISWGPTLSKTMIVSPIDVLSMRVLVNDDLPMEDVILEYKINGETLIRNPLTVDVPDRELDLQWDWDLMRREDDDKLHSLQLEGGDIIQTRVVAIDRKGQLGESGYIDILVAEPGFDRNRHQHLIPLHSLTQAVADWSQQAIDLMDKVSEFEKQPPPKSLLAARDTAAELHVEREILTQQIQQQIQLSGKSVDSAEWELVGRGLTKLDSAIQDWFTESVWISEQESEAWKENREQAHSEQISQSKQLVQDATRIKRYSQAIFGHALTVGIVDDAMSLQRSLTPLTNSETTIPDERLPRHVKVAQGRLEAIESLIQKHEEALPESTKRHLENWTRWIDSWASRLQTSIKEPPSGEAHRALIEQFATELRNQHRSSMFDGRLNATMSDILRELQIQLGSSGDNVRQMLKSGSAAVTARKDQTEADSDSANASKAARDLALANLRFSLARETLLNRLSHDESLHRSRLNLDPQFAADLNLMHRAIENVTENGFQPYREESPVIVHQNLSYAFQTLEAYHLALMYLDELRALMLAERNLESNATSKLGHALQIQRIGVGMEWPVHTMINARLKPEPETRILDRVRFGKQFNLARTRIISRRWSDDPMVAADRALSEMERVFASAMAALLPGVEQARDTIRQYVLTLPEQAREAAEKVKEAEQRTEARPDSTNETTEDLAEKQQEAEAATQETLEALVNFANTAEITDQEQRELARDADAATAQIQDSADRAEESMNEAKMAPNDQKRQEALDQTAQALEQLADALEQTAAHFEAAENGEDVSESREQLRQAEAALAMQNELDQRFNEAEEMAQSAESTPQELMEQLEQELKQNEPMQQELSEIAQRAAESAQQELENAAQEERNLNRDLENADPSIDEQKRRATEQLSNLAARTTTLEQALVQKAESAVSKGQGNVPEAQEDLKQARESLRDAAKQASQLAGKQSLLSDMQQTAQAMSEAIEEAKQALASAKEPTDKATQENIHRDDASRKRTEQQLEAAARDARAQQIRNATSERQQWSAAKREAARRATDARNQKRNAENRKRQIESQLSREQGNTDNLKRDIQETQTLIDNANKAEKAANETQAFADEREKSAGQREQNTRNQALPSLDKPNPAAELAARMTEQTQGELDQIQEALRELSNGLGIEDQLRVPEATAEQLARRQDQIQQQIDNATEQLRRAARHEERLGQDEISEQLTATADAIEQTASQASENASNTLEEAAATPEKSPQANRDVANASEQISQAAQELAELLANSPPQNAGESSEQTSQQADQESASNQQGEASPEQQQGQQMARTLDELDRAMAQSQQSQSEQSQSSQDGQPSEQQPGQPSEQQAGQQPGQEPGQEAGQPSGQPQTAGEASPTLANAMQSQSQQSARDRQAQMNPNQPSPSQGSNPATESGAGMQMPAGGKIDISQIERAGTDWGQLRERRTADASESRAASVAPQYRSEIEAYFRAIATRAAEKSE